MSVPEFQIAKLGIKAGEIVILRHAPPKGAFPGHTVKLIESAHEAVREALDTVGLTEDKVPILAFSDQWEIAVMHPVELLAKMAAAKDTEDRARDPE